MIGTTPECKSWVASRFTVIEDGGICKRRCKHPECDKEYSRGTSHMILKRHWARAHADIFSLSPRSRTSIPNSPGQVGSTVKPPPIRRKPTSPHKLGNSCQTGTGEPKVGLQNFNNNLSSAHKLSNHDKSQQFDVKQVSKRLREASSIHLTFDIHTPKKGGKTFGIITAHSLSDSLDIRSVLLEYRHLPYPNDTTAIYEFLRSCIAKFNCREKIISIANNGSEAVSAAIQELDKRFRLSKNYNFSTIHIKCFPQFVHLNVNDVLRSQETLIGGIRKIVGFINNNNFTMRPLSQNNNTESQGEISENQVVDNASTENIEHDVKPTGLKLPLDNRSSWNTTLTMIETFLQQRGFIEPTLMYFQGTQELTDITIDWDRLFSLVQLLKPFHEIINKFAIDNYTPVSLVAAVIPHLMDHLSVTWNYEDLAMSAHQFKIQLESYWELFQSDLTVIAGLIDPRIKDTFTTPDRRDDVINALRNRLGDTLRIQEPDQSILSKIVAPRNQDEILDYLEKPRECGEISVLAYWECHRRSYPALYNLARTLACIQATSVPCDRLFSAAENMEKERKFQVDSTNSKELMKSWAKYLEK